MECFPTLVAFVCNQTRQGRVAARPMGAAAEWIWKYFFGEVNAVFSGACDGQKLLLFVLCCVVLRTTLNFHWKFSDGFSWAHLKCKVKPSEFIQCEWKSAVVLISKLCIRNMCIQIRLEINLSLRQEINDPLCFDFQFPFGSRARNIFYFWYSSKTKQTFSTFSLQRVVQTLCLSVGLVRCCWSIVSSAWNVKWLNRYDDDDERTF